MKRISVALCSALVLGLAVVGTARAQEAPRYDDDYNSCPAKSWEKCDDAGGKFYKYDGKKFCFIEGDKKFLKCEYGFKAIGQKNIKWVYDRHSYRDDSCKKKEDLEIVKCWKKSYRDGDWNRVDDDECEDKCKLSRW